MSSDKKLALVLTPIKLPTPDEMMKLVLDLELRLLADVTKGREELKRVFGTEDRPHPEPGRYYTARSEILPLVLLTTPRPWRTREGGTRFRGILRLAARGRLARWNTMRVERS